MVRAEGLEPTPALRPNGFSYPATALGAAPALAMGIGVWTIAPPCRLRFRCYPSSLYTWTTLRRRWLAALRKLRARHSSARAGSSINRRKMVPGVGLEPTLPLPGKGF